MTVTAAGDLIYTGTLVTDEIRGQLLRMSRGLAVMLLLVLVLPRLRFCLSPLIFIWDGF